jgi:hypothetical protein
MQLRGPRSAQKRKIALHGAQRDRKPGRGRHSLRRFFLGAAPMTEEQKQQRIVELEGRTNATAGGDRRRRTVDRDVRGSQAAIWCLLDAPERSDSLIGLVGAPFIATPCRSGSPAAAAPSVRARVDVSTPALAALHARAERRHLGLGRIVRHVDQRRVTAGIVEAGRDQPAARRARARCGASSAG